jgi:hypothetical protein
LRQRRQPARVVDAFIEGLHLTEADPDARSMKTDGTGAVNFHMQTSVETKLASDRVQLSCMTTIEHGMPFHRYWSFDCGSSALTGKCTPSTERRATRWEHEQVLEDAQRRLDRMPDAMRIRHSSVELAFGTLEMWMGSAHA